MSPLFAIFFLSDEKHNLLGGGSIGPGWGIGKAISVAYAKAGALVVVTDSVVSAAEETLSLCEGEAAGEARAVDVTDDEALSAALLDVVKLYGRIDILYCNVAYAQYCVVPIEQVLPVPSGISDVEASAIPETFFTVWTNLVRIGRLAKGESVLVHGGASGIGTTAIQLAAAMGARVFCTAGSDRKLQECRRLGAEIAIDYKTENFASRVLDETDGRGVDVILDLVCAPYVMPNLECLAIEGRLVIISFLGGGEATVDFERLVRRRQTICGSTLRPQTPQQKGSIARDLEERVWPLLESGRIRPVIQSLHPLENAAAAHRELEAGDHVGKIVLRVA